MKRNKAARRGGLQWVLIFAAAMVVATLWAQTPDKPGPAALAKARAAMLKKDTSPKIGRASCRERVSSPV